MEVIKNFMIKEKLENMKNSLVKSEKNGNKKSIENLIVLAVILIITIIAINYIWNGKDKKQNNLTESRILADEQIEENSMKYNNDELEQKLKQILSNINGVGEVEVLITYSQTSTINPVYNEDYQESVTEEEDTSGGKRTISSSNNKKEVVSNNDTIVTQSVTSPQIQGAVIIAKGAGNVQVKSNIIQAVEAATGLSSYKIQVFEMN